jgi:hypothetical protein
LLHAALIEALLVMLKSTFETLSVEEQLSQVCNDQSFLQWFCELHPPSKRDEAVQEEIKKFAKERKLLDILRDFNPNTTPKEYIEMLWMIARVGIVVVFSFAVSFLDAYRLDDVSVGNEISAKFGNILQSLVINNISNETLIEGACIIIGLISCSNSEGLLIILFVSLLSSHLLESESARNSLFNSGVIDILVSCLKVHTKNNTIVQRTCKALTNVCFHSGMLL